MDRKLSAEIRRAHVVKLQEIAFAPAAPWTFRRGIAVVQLPGGSEEGREWMDSGSKPSEPYALLRRRNTHTLPSARPMKIVPGSGTGPTFHPMASITCVSTVLHWPVTP